MNKMFLIVGRSSSGKDSLTNKLCQDLNLKQVISYATRPQRKNEGNTHIFIKSEGVEQYKNQFAAYTKIGDYEYFTTLEQILSGKYQFYVIDPNGVEFLKEKIKNIEFVTIYIHADEAICRERAKLRGDTEEDIDKRFNAERKQFEEFTQQIKYDYMVKNNVFDKAYQILKQIVLIELDGS